MTEQERLRAVVGWLSDLANITAGNAPLADSKAKIGTMASLLVTGFPADAFCRASLDFVAQECRFFPPYADVNKHLGNWCRSHRPQPAIVAPPADHYERYNIPKPRDPPTEAEMEYVAEVVRKLKMETGYRQSQAWSSTPPAPQAAAAMTDRQLLAMHEATGNTIRAAALRSKITAAEKILPFRPAP